MILFFSPHLPQIVNKACYSFHYRPWYIDPGSTTFFRRGSRQKSGESTGVVQNIAETQLSGEQRIGCDTPRTPHDPEVSAVAVPASAIRPVRTTHLGNNIILQFFVYFDL